MTTTSARAGAHAARRIVAIRALMLLVMKPSIKHEIDGDGADGDGAAETRLGVHEKAGGLRIDTVDLDLDVGRAERIPAHTYAVGALCRHASRGAVVVVGQHLAEAVAGHCIPRARNADEAVGLRHFGLQHNIVPVQHRACRVKPHPACRQRDHRGLAARERYGNGEGQLAVHLTGAQGERAMLDDEVHCMFARDGRLVGLVATHGERRADARVAIVLLPRDIPAVQVADRDLVIHFLCGAQHRVSVAHMTVVRDHENGHADAANTHAPLIRQLDLRECPAEVSAIVVRAILADQALTGQRQPVVDAVVGLQAEVGVDTGARRLAGAAGLAGACELGVVGIGPGEGEWIILWKRVKGGLTESAFAEDTLESTERMHELRAYGICFSLDEVGTGHSFMRDVGTNPESVPVVEAIILLTGKLKLDIVVEGVEDEAQRSFLIHGGCFSMQGFPLGRPLPIAEFERL
ncbi:EAL domain-containing protein [Massilia sp. TW-1]|uniref:EAL domain-containing protein n=2 Tax=Telluria antibiotica TaxID=2717319 RepID=A0ABX0P7G8_9BURK|nr:EAL domain-containing protein [Telluria antibiotica]